MSTSTYVYLTSGNFWLYTHGVVYSTSKERGIVCYIDTNFYSGWTQADSNNTENVMSHSGYVIMYVVCNVLWCSNLQTDIN